LIRIAIILCNESEDIETIVPTELWRRAGILVDLISLEKKNNIVLQNQTKICCNKIISEVNLTQYNALYLPGGNGHVKYREESWTPKNNANVTKLVKYIDKFAANPDKYLLAMCASPLILGERKLLVGHKATGYPGFQDSYKQQYLDESVVVSKNIITGRAPGSAFDFAYKVIEILVDAETALKVKEDIIDNN